MGSSIQDTREYAINLELSNTKTNKKAINQDNVRLGTSRLEDTNESKSSNQDKTSTVKPSWYQRNKTKYNKQKRKDYNLKTQLKKKEQKNNKKNLNPRDRFNAAFYGKVDNINQVYNSLNDGTDGKRNLILSFDELVAFAENRLLPQRERLIHTGTVTTRFFARPEIIKSILSHSWLFYSEINRDFKDKVSDRQLKRTLQELVKKRWLIRWGNYDATYYYPNPFLAALYSLDHEYKNLAEYSRLNIDFMDLLNLPLLNLLNSGLKVLDVKMDFIDYFESAEAIWIKTWFMGYMNIEFTTNQGIYNIYLPVNRHGANKREGKINNPCGFLHLTLPLKWLFFDIIESSGLNGHRSYIHFDNSFKIVCYEKFDNLHGDFCYTNFKKMFEPLFLERKEYTKEEQKIKGKKSVENKHNAWSSKETEYVEVDSFETLQRLFIFRFVDGKRRSELFDTLGIHYAKTKKPPYAD